VVKWLAIECAGIAGGGGNPVRLPDPLGFLLLEAIAVKVAQSWLLTGTSLLLGAVAWLQMPVGAEQQPNNRLRARALVPRDGTEVDVMEMVFPNRYLELAKKIKKAVEGNREWFLSHVNKAAAAGKPLPYDRRLGVTKEEYEELRKLGEQKTLKKVGSVKLRVKQIGDRYAFDGGSDLPDLKGLVLDVKTSTVTTPFGEAKERTTIKANENQTLTGPWNGLQWKLEKISASPRAVTLAKLALGRLVKSGRGILYYDVSHVGEKSKKTVTYTLQYDLPPSE
jgi:hypothetical protein